LTPLHLAVRAAETQKSTRSVRHILIKGAKRNVQDKFGRTAMDVVEQTEFSDYDIKKELLEYLVIILV
jgi:hypothetical protein